MERPNGGSLSGPDGANAATAHHTIVLESSSTISDELHRLVDSAIDSIDGATLASFAFAIGADPERSQIVVDNADIIAAVHDADAGLDDGPSGSARATGEVVRISSTADDGPWEPFRDACRSIGIMSTASFPINVGGERPATLTVFSPDYHAFDVEAIRTGRQIAGHIGQAIEAAGVHWYQTTADSTR